MSRQPMGEAVAGFVPSTYSYLWRDDLPAAIAGLASASFAQAELMAALPHVDLMDRGDVLAEEIRAASSRTGLTVAGVNPPGLDLNLSSPDASMRRWSVETYLAIGRLGAEVGSRYLVVHPGRRHVLVPAPEEQARGWALEGVATIAAGMADVGLRVLFENTPTGILDTAEECVGLVQDLGAANVGLVYDVANGFMVEDPAHGLRTAGSLLEAVHLSDTTSARWLHDPIGTGEVDFAACAAVLDDLGFEGDIVLETVHAGDIARGLTRDVERLRAAGWKG